MPQGSVNRPVHDNTVSYLIQSMIWGYVQVVSKEDMKDSDHSNNLVTD